MKAAALWGTLLLAPTLVAGQCSSELPHCADNENQNRQETEHSCKDQVGEPCFSDLAQWQIDRVLAAHNKYRAKHGSCPLTYSHTIAAYSKRSPGFQQTCASNIFQHNSPAKDDVTGDSYGENLAMVSSAVQLQDWDCSQGVNMWYCGEEGCWDYDAVTGGGTGHMTQVVWKDSTEVGCALCHVANGGFTNKYFICNYLSQGNFGSKGPGGAYSKNVLEPGTAATGCPVTDSEKAPQEGASTVPALGLLLVTVLSLSIL